jgi:translocator protein
MTYLIIMTIFFIATLVVNALSNILPINGQTTSDVSNKIDVLFTPAGYVFSIWGLIYLLVAVWLILLFVRNRKDTFTNQRLTILFCLSCIFNIGWLLSFHYEYFVLSNFVIVALLVTLILIYLSYPTGDSRFGGRLPFSVYLGWITVATIANISYTLKWHEVSLGINEVSGTILLLVVAGIVAVVGRYISDDPYFAVVFVWAIVGVAESNTASNLVTAAYIIAIIIFILVIVFSFTPKRFTVPKA